MAAGDLFLGVDGGGTQCRARLADRAGRILGEGIAGPANIRLGLEASLAAPADDGHARHAKVMDALSGHALAAYRSLVQTPDFMAYFRGSTPLAEISALNIGSRPASRKGSERLEDLRAIPWVFSWSIARVMLPGWFGFGGSGRVLV